MFLFPLYILCPIMGADGRFAEHHSASSSRPRRSRLRAVDRGELFNGFSRKLVAKIAAPLLKIK